MKIYSTLFNIEILKLDCLIILVSLASCQSSHFYRPKPNEAVLLTHKNQTKINFIGDEIMVAASAAYSPKENLGVQLSIGAGTDGSDMYYEKYFNPSVAAGYYKKISKDVLTEIYAGAGIYNYKNTVDEHIKAIHYSDYFLQPTIAYIGRNAELAFTIRGDYMKRNKTEILNNNYPDTAEFKYSFLKYTNYYFIQPDVTIRFGFRYIKFQIQLTQSIPLKNNYASIYGIEMGYNSQSEAPVNNLRWASGVNIDLDILKKKKIKNNY